MSQAVRGEPNLQNDNFRMRRAALEIASDIQVTGGPHNRFEQTLYDLAEVAGVSQTEIDAATLSKTPILIGFEKYIDVE